MSNHLQPAPAMIELGRNASVNEQYDDHMTCLGPCTGPLAYISEDGRSGYGTEVSAQFPSDYVREFEKSAPNGSVQLASADASAAAWESYAKHDLWRAPGH